MWGLWGGNALGVCDVSGCGMGSVSEDILRMSWLTRLVLSYNRIVNLPTGITVLTQLQVRALLCVQCAGRQC